MSPCTNFELVATGSPFCIETNLAGRGFLRMIEEWHHLDYLVRLRFSALESADLAVARVAARVAAGVHDIPESTIRRRWEIGLRCFFELYASVVDDWKFYDNSSQQITLVAQQTASGEQEILDHDRWNRYRSLVL